MKNNVEFFIETSLKVRNWAISHPFVTNDLMNWCAICSEKIFEILSEKGFNPVFCRVFRRPIFFNEITRQAHCFVVCDNYLIDCTATQFGKQEIVVEEIQNLEENWFWNLNKAQKFYTLEDIKVEMTFWDDDCNPFSISNQNKLIDLESEFEVFIPEINFEVMLF